MREKRSSTISAAQALKALLQVGYQTVQPDPDHRPRPTERAEGRGSRDVALSRSGKSIQLFFNGVLPNEEQRAYKLLVPAKGMLTQNELKFIENGAKIKIADYVP